MNFHIYAIAHKLEQARRRKIKRLIITIPPRFLKTFTTSVAFPAYVLGHDPSTRIIVVSYGADLAIKISNEFRTIICHADYQRYFPLTLPSRIKNTEMEFSTTKNGGRLATTIDGSLTGRGADILIIDDPLKPADAFSNSRRDICQQLVLQHAFVAPG